MHLARGRETALPFNQNLVVQFSFISAALITAIAVAIAVLLTSRLDRNIELLQEHGKAMMSGTMIKPSDPYSIVSLTNDVQTLERLTYLALTSGFIVLYGSLFGMVWRGWRTITEQRSQLKAANLELEARVRQRTDELETANADLRKEFAERERAQAALAEHSEELIRSNADLEQFAYAASHDLQEPLRAVAGLTSVLARRYKDTVADDPDSLVPRIVTAAARMQALVNDLWTYSRIGRGNDPLEPTDCDDVADRGIEDLQRSITDSGASVTHDPLPVVMGSAPLLSQVFGNLIGNSLKFRGEASPRVHVSAERQGDAWVFSVADNGLGIDPAYADRIFVVFQRLHTIDEYAGTGIGLAICKKAVERLCGRIWFESQPGQGTTFFFTLPAQGSSAPGC